MDISYDMIVQEKLPVFDGIYCGDVIYEFAVENNGSQRKAVRIGLSDSIKESYIPSVVCTLYETTAENYMKLECGEGAYGGIGFVCLSDMSGKIVFLACFEESNPFIHAVMEKDCISAVNNLGETWTFSPDADGLPSIDISRI